MKKLKSRCAIMMAAFLITGTFPVNAYSEEIPDRLETELSAPQTEAPEQTEAPKQTKAPEQTKAVVTLRSVPKDFDLNSGSEGGNTIPDNNKIPGGDEQGGNTMPGGDDEGGDGQDDSGNIENEYEDYDIETEFECYHELTYEVSQNIIDPTCSAPGSYDNVTYCSDCDEQVDLLTIKLEMIPAAHKSVQTIPYTAPTCLEAGNIEYYACADCGNRFLPEDPGTFLTLEEVTIDPKGHSWGEWQVTLNAACTTHGQKTKICRNDPSHVETLPLEPTGHKPKVTVSAVDPTCEEDGNILYHICEKCDMWIDENSVPITDHSSVIQKAAGHQWGDWKTTRKPSCEAPGEKARTCASDSSHVDTRILPAVGHSPSAPVIKNTVEITGTGKKTYDEVIYCSVCSKELSRTTHTVSSSGGNKGSSPSGERLKLPKSGAFDAAGRTEHKFQLPCKDVGMISLDLEDQYVKVSSLASDDKDLLALTSQMAFTVSPEREGILKIELSDILDKLIVYIRNSFKETNPYPAGSSSETMSEYFERMKKAEEEALDQEFTCQVDIGKENAERSYDAYYMDKKTEKWISAGMVTASATGYITIKSSFNIGVTFILIPRELKAGNTPLHGLPAETADVISIETVDHNSNVLRAIQDGQSIEVISYADEEAAAE